LARWGLRWFLLALLWLALTDTLKAPELAAGAVAAAVGASLAALVSLPGGPREPRTLLRLARLGPRRLARPLIRLVVDTAIVTGALWSRIAHRRPVQGSFRAARYPVHGDRASAAGRTLTEAWGSLPPNRYVVGIDEEQGLILVHELVRTAEPLDPLGRA
jgi:multisubunit Na+/H+ antiporter MnhE subunit